MVKQLELHYPVLAVKPEISNRISSQPNIRLRPGYRPASAYCRLITDCFFEQTILSAYDVFITVVAGAENGAAMNKASVEQPDEILVVEAILGNLDAFNELTASYRAAVIRTAQASVGREFAEDVAQDALLLAFKALPSIEEPTKFAAWLSAITRHRAMRFGKRESQLRSRSVALDEVLLEKVGALSQPFAGESENAELRRALETVPEEYAWC
jgi:hypothetical protein